MVRLISVRGDERRLICTPVGIYHEPERPHVGITAAVLEALQAHGPATVTDLRLRLHAAGRWVSRQSIWNSLTSHRRKGRVAAAKQGKRLVFSAVAPQ